MTNGFSMYAVARVDGGDQHGVLAMMSKAGQGESNGVYHVNDPDPGIGRVWKFHVWNNPPGENRTPNWNALQPFGEVLVLSMVAKLRAHTATSVQGQSTAGLADPAVFLWFNEPVTNIDQIDDYIIGGRLADPDIDIDAVIMDVVYANEPHSPAVQQAVTRFLAAKNRLPVGV
jgi:hypothetical protein